MVCVMNKLAEAHPHVCITVIERIHSEEHFAVLAGKSKLAFYFIKIVDLSYRGCVSVVFFKHKLSVCVFIIFYFVIEHSFALEIVVTLRVNENDRALFSEFVDDVHILALAIGKSVGVEGLENTAENNEHESYRSDYLICLQCKS